LLDVVKDILWHENLDNKSGLILCFFFPKKFGLERTVNPIIRRLFYDSYGCHSWVRGSVFGRTPSRCHVRYHFRSVGDIGEIINIPRLPPSRDRKDNGKAESEEQASGFHNNSESKKRKRENKDTAETFSCVSLIKIGEKISESQAIGKIFF
jgi:hypothetical protein